MIILPTEKSGQFAVMTMGTYIKADMVHVDGDEKISLDDLKNNQLNINGHVSMLIKIFGLGKDWNHDTRMRESMISVLCLNATRVWNIIQVRSPLPGQLLEETKV